MHVGHAHTSTRPSSRARPRRRRCGARAIVAAPLPLLPRRRLCLHLARVACIDERHPQLQPHAVVGARRGNRDDVAARVQRRAEGPMHVRQAVERTRLGLRERGRCPLGNMGQGCHRRCVAAAEHRGLQASQQQRESQRAHPRAHGGAGGSTSRAATLIAPADGANEAGDTTSPPLPSRWAASDSGAARGAGNSVSALRSRARPSASTGAAADDATAPLIEGTACASPDCTLRTAAAAAAAADATAAAVRFLRLRASPRAIGTPCRDALASSLMRHSGSPSWFTSSAYTHLCAFAGIRPGHSVASTSAAVSRECDTGLDRTMYTSPLTAASQPLAGE